MRKVLPAELASNFNVLITRCNTHFPRCFTRRLSPIRYSPIPSPLPLRSCLLQPSRESDVTYSPSAHTALKTTAYEPAATSGHHPSVDASQGG